LNEDETHRFEMIVLPHLNAAYNLARWLTRNDFDAQDLVQTAFVRAFKFFDGFHGGNARAWLLTIVRHTFYTSLRDNQHEDANVDFDETTHTIHQSSSYGIGNNPESIATSHDTSRVVNQALEQLPDAFREILILKEMEDLSYKEIADVVGIPIGTVMSRLSRGRKMLVEALKLVGGSNGL
jgi:RNA polymerase sigma-70 factor (ECF subfamily)